MTKSQKVKLKELRYIISRNVFLLTNGILFAVVIMLFIFGNTQAGIFLGIVSLANVFFGLFQDIRAWLALEKLQLLTAPRVFRILTDGSVESILTEDVNKGDRLKLKIGDQVPCDSILEEGVGFEINEGLITGESNSFAKNVGERLLAGSIITSGSGIVKTEAVFHESRIARMTEGIKRYSTSESPIQKGVTLVIKISGYVLVVALLFILVRGFVTHESSVRMVLQIGALTSLIVPQGLIFAVSLFFAYGAAHLYRRNVLLQEVNATEKLGRIKNLCMDKTGTLTQNELIVENIFVPTNVNKIEAEKNMSAYITGSKESSQMILAVKNFIKTSSEVEVTECQPFSSWRQYGAVKIKSEHSEEVFLAGPPDVFLPHIQDLEQRKWLGDLLALHTNQGKRTFCLVKLQGNHIPKDLSGLVLTPIALFVFFNKLQDGVKEAIEFFQNRGVHIRIISGDNPETVRAVSALAGINNTDKVITGKELEKWTEEDFKERTKQYFIFARILPEQKEKIITALKRNGYTAMVGDGANDALAIKKADLGIAMFDGAPATRQLAAIVLTNNSFAALPGGVELADNVIRSVEVFSGLFFNQALMGAIFFTVISLFGAAYPLTPLNITFINYFTVGIPGLLISYWAIRPSGKAHSIVGQPFLKRVLPFAAISAVVQTIGLMFFYFLSPTYLKEADSNTLVLLALIVFGLIFFAFAPYVYRGSLLVKQKIQIVFWIILEIILLYAAFKVPFVIALFNLNKFSLDTIAIWWAALITFIVFILQYSIASIVIRSQKNKIV